MVGGGAAGAAAGGLVPAASAGGAEYGVASLAEEQFLPNSNIQVRLEGSAAGGAPFL
jgi:hypothetical protein